MDFLESRKQSIPHNYIISVCRFSFLFVVVISCLWDCLLACLCAKDWMSSKCSSAELCTSPQDFPKSLRQGSDFSEDDCFLGATPECVGSLDSVLLTFPHLCLSLLLLPCYILLYGRVSYVCIANTSYLSLPWIQNKCLIFRLFYWHFSICLLSFA